MFKTELRFEDYLDTLSYKKRITLTRFRTGNHRLPIEKGRWDNINRPERVCPLCTNGALGDEFHYLFECEHLKMQRKNYISRYYTRHPNVLKTNQLLNSGPLRELNKLATFCQRIMELF